jgi:hypothetical protein
MFELGKQYKFKVKNPESEKGFVFYTGKITDVSENQIFIITIKEEHVSFSLREILKSKEDI